MRDADGALGRIRNLMCVPFFPGAAARSLGSANCLAYRGRESRAGIPSEDQPYTVVLGLVEPLEPNATHVRVHLVKLAMVLKNY